MPAWRPFTIGLCLCLGFYQADSVRAEDLLPLPLPRAFLKPEPENGRDLRDMQIHLQKLAAKVLPLTVGLHVGTSQGSGVIISKEGYILTVAHVAGRPGQVAEIILHDGRKIKGKTLGSNLAIDSGLVKITEPGYWMHADMAQTSDLRAGQWCLAVGHPLGYQEGRAPVARLGRILEVEKTFIRTDCPLVGGDSGGPLFDMFGQVIGIHSRIGRLMSANIHVPADTYRDTWDRLTKGEIWGSNLFEHGLDAYLGLRLDSAGRVTLVAPNSPADKVGIKVNDMLTQFDGRHVSSGSDLDMLLRDKQPGTEVALQLRRGDSIVNLRLGFGEALKKNGGRRAEDGRKIACSFFVLRPPSSVLCPRRHPCTNAFC